MTSLAKIPNLRHLRILLAVTRLQSVSRASEHINMSQPAVTQAIAKMEADYGTELFERRSIGSFPTQAGSILIRRIDRFFEIADTAVRLARSAPRSPEAAAPTQIEQLLTATQIRAFLATIDSPRTSEIAGALGISVTSLSRSAREMENALRRPLFRRTATGMEGNPAGIALARGLRIAIRELEYGKQELDELTHAGNPVISIGVLPMSGSLILASAVKELMRALPDVRIIILDGTYLSLLDRLRSGGIDMMFGLLRRPDWADDVVEEPLFDDTFCVVGRRNHPLTRVAHVTKEDLAAYTWIVPAPGTPRRHQIDRLFGEIEPQPRLGVETSSLASIRALVMSSDLLTIMSRQEVDLEERTGLFATLNCELRSELPPKGITVRRDWLPTEVHSRFMVLLRKHATENQRAPEPARAPRRAHAALALRRGGEGFAATARRRPAEAGSPR